MPSVKYSRHGQGELSHLAQVGALAAQDHLVYEKSEALDKVCSCVTGRGGGLKGDHTLS